MRTPVVLFFILLYSLTSLGNDREMELHGLIDVTTLDSTIVVDLMYAKADNFVGEVMYRDSQRAYLHPHAAKAIVRASSALRALNPSYRLKICDAARPMSVQRKMYQKVRRTPLAKYVSNPGRGGGLHNYGLAVDITIVDEYGNELPMGTKADHLGKESNIDNEHHLVKTGVISKKELANRLLLRKVMKEGGFKPISSEWWHFNLCSRNYAKRHYHLLDF